MNLQTRGKSGHNEKPVELGTCDATKVPHTKQSCTENADWKPVEAPAQQEYVTAVQSNQTMCSGTLRYLDMQSAPAPASEAESERQVAWVLEQIEQGHRNTLGFCDFVTLRAALLKERREREYLRGALVKIAMMDCQHDSEMRELCARCIASTALIGESRG